MAITFSTPIKTKRLETVRDAIDTGSGTAYMNLYDGTRPTHADDAVSGDATLLAQIPLNNPCGTVSGREMRFINTPALEDPSPPATGDATWCRFVDGDGNTVMDASVGTNAFTNFVRLPSTTITAGVAFKLDYIFLFESGV